MTTGPFKRLLYYFIYPACLYFTIIVLILSGVATAVGNPSLAPRLVSLLWFWVFSLLMAGLGNIFRIKKYNMAVKVLLHYFGTIISFILVFLVAISNFDNAAGAFIAVLLLSVVYFFISALVLLIRGALVKSDKKNEKYKRQFDGM